MLSDWQEMIVIGIVVNITHKTIRCQRSRVILLSYQVQKRNITGYKC